MTLPHSFLDEAGPGGVMRPIKRWPGYYAGSDGGVYSKKSGRFERLAVWLSGRPWCKYPRVTLWNGKRRANFAVHFLIASAFVGKRPRRTSQVRHKDGDRFNNAPTNLRWGTKKANEKDKIAHGTAPRGERNGRRKLDDEKIRAIRTSLLADEVLAKMMKVKPRTIARVRYGEAWRHVAA